ncbi:DUF4302 domain-containing protein [Pedobacter lusitanus]|uniref:DUF4302 domain-containing protein n=1 Tax=Pedobacter lusitanus TaxID=1503925 RepID=UPI000AF21F18|nr:DUF4302 domain-containing protein [Pedobacter lusitanus]
MKRIIIYALLSIGVFSGCKKNNEILVDGERPEDRVAEALTKYSDQLTDSPYGWKAYLYPAGGGGFSFYLNFTKKNRVTMYSDLDNGPATTAKESSYRLRASMNPSLVFDTYNYMHILADPDARVFGGTPGWGLYSDFEFNFGVQTGDTLKLTGKLLDSKLVMVRATKAEQDAYNNKGLLTSLVTSTDYIAANSTLYTNIDGAVNLQTIFDYFQKKMTLVWDDKGTISSAISPFVFTLNGILLQDPVSYKGKLLREFIWDAATQGFYTTVDGKRFDLKSSPSPLLPLNALIGINYTSVTVPNGTTYPGWSADFIARRAKAASGTLTSGYNLRLDKMALVFNVNQSMLTLTADVYQTANKFLAIYPYSYTKTPAGVYKFTLGAMNGNASVIATAMAPLLSERLGADTFTLDYFTNLTNKQVLGQFKSVEHPDFAFTGTLQ